MHHILLSFHTAVGKCKVVGRARQLVAARPLLECFCPFGTRGVLSSRRSARQRWRFTTAVPDSDTPVNFYCSIRERTQTTLNTTASKVSPLSCQLVFTHDDQHRPSHMKRGKARYSRRSVTTELYYVMARYSRTCVIFIGRCTALHRNAERQNTL